MLAVLWFVMLLVVLLVVDRFVFRHIIFPFFSVFYVCDLGVSA